MKESDDFVKNEKSYTLNGGGVFLDQRVPENTPTTSWLRKKRESEEQKKPSSNHTEYKQQHFKFTIPQPLKKKKNK